MAQTEVTELAGNTHESQSRHKNTNLNVTQSRNTNTDMNMTLTGAALFISGMCLQTVN